MSAELPAPLTPAECDLRDFAHMQFDVARFRDSEFAAIEDDAAFRAGVMAWAVCWHQVPAASLPDDDRQLSRLLGYGRDVEGWKRARAAGALHGFKLCSDGLLYHEVVAEKARAAWASKQRAREAGIRGNEKRWGKVAGQSSSSPKPDPAAITPKSSPDRPPIATQSQEDSHSNDSASPPDRKREGEGEREGESFAVFSSEKTVNEKTSQKSKRADRGERLPASWQPDAACRQFAISLALDPDRVAASFLDYWHSKPGKDGTKSDWPATWRNWCRREAPQGPQQRQAAPAPREPSPPLGAPPQPSPRHVWVASCGKWVNRDDLAT